jgi:hypothetical protein
VKSGCMLHRIRERSPDETALPAKKLFTTRYDDNY